MLPIVEAIRQRILSRSQARAMAFQVPRTRRPEPLHYTQHTQSRTEKTPLFGASADAFGLDWVQTHSIPAPVQGIVRSDVDKPTWQRGGSIVNLGLKEPSARPYEDPAISRSFKKSYEPTDQRAMSHGGSPVSRWDGQVRNFGKRSGFERSRKPSQLTAGDKLAAEMKAEPYDFRV